MTLTTPVSIPRSERAITYEDRVLMLGSCFSDAIAAKLREYFFSVTANPFGTLYNPISIAHHMTDPLLADKSVVIITFGTAWVYLDKQRLDSSQCAERNLAAVVDNCQKRPATDFIRYRLTVEDILSAWQPILDRYPDKHFIFTVSPIRHKKDGLHENQISKGILLQAVDYLTAKCSIRSGASSSYFPSYEILLDELRDYRFYADDLVHPSTSAVQIIWERFVDTYFYEELTQKSMRELHQFYLNSQHRQLHPESAEAQAFLRYLEKEKQDLQSRFPNLTIR